MRLPEGAGLFGCDFVQVSKLISDVHPGSKVLGAGKLELVDGRHTHGRDQLLPILTGFGSPMNVLHDFFRMHVAIDRNKVTPSKMLSMSIPQSVVGVSDQVQRTLDELLRYHDLLPIPR